MSREWEEERQRIRAAVSLRVEALLERAEIETGEKEIETLREAVLELQEKNIWDESIIKLYRELQAEINQLKLENEK